MRKIIQTNTDTLDLLSDNRLMLKAKDGDLDQLGLLFERYHRVLYSFFYNRNQDGGLSEDLVQDVFVRIMKYRHNYRGGDFKSWLFHIARNVQHDHFRRRGLGPLEDVDQWKDVIPDENLDEPRRLIGHEESRQLRDALRRLDPEKREVIVLAKLKGLKYKEIGDLLGCTEGAVKIKVFRALKDLRKYYLKAL